MREIIITKVLTMLAELRVAGAIHQEAAQPDLTTIPTLTITEGITITRVITRALSIIITIQDQQINHNNKCSNHLKNIKEVAAIIQISTVVVATINITIRTEIVKTNIIL